jgi:hypothetical protein
MDSQLLSQPHHMNPGGAACYLEGFAAAMASVGHTPGTIRGYLDSAIHFGGWVEASGLNFADINEQTIQAFGAHRCERPGGRRERRVSRGYTARVQRFADYLPQQGAIAGLVCSTTDPSSPLTAFRDWLLRHRGLAIRTVERHERLITRMLPALGANAGEYNAALVRGVILDQIRGCRPAHAKTQKQSSERSASICDFSQRTAHASPVSTIRCQPWRNGNFHRCHDISTPDK